jgi:hypothetical protein
MSLPHSNQKTQFSENLNILIIFPQVYPKMGIFKMLFNNTIFWLFVFYKRASGFNGQKILKTDE